MTHRLLLGSPHYRENARYWAADRVPAEQWGLHQRTSLRFFCDLSWGSCHFGRRVKSCQPFPWVPIEDGGRQVPTVDDIATADGVTVISEEDSISDQLAAIRLSRVNPFISEARAG